MSRSPSLALKLALAVVSTIFAICLLEGALRAVDVFGSGSSVDDVVNEVNADLDSQLKASAAADLAEASGRFSLFGLVEASEHEDLVYRIKPNLSGTFRGQKISTNVYGQRQESVPQVPKPEGVFRVVGIGDSYMFGWGVAQGETYLELVERQLNASDNGDSGGSGGIDGKSIEQRVEVVNCSAPGYNSALEAAKFEHECRQFDPDLVVLHWISNDFGYPHFMQPVSAGEDSSESASSTGAAQSAEKHRPRSYLLAALSSLVGSSANEPPFQASGELDPEAMPELLRRRGESTQHLRRAARSQYHSMVGAEGGVRALQRIQRLAGDVPVLLLISGTRGTDRALVVTTARSLGFQVIDADPQFARALRATGVEGTAKQYKAMYQIPRDGHPTVEAHKQYAVVLVDAIKAHLH